MIQAIDLAVEFDRLQGSLFEGVHLSLRRSDKVALVGPNGCGKSTLLLTLCGEIRPSQGHVQVAHSCRIARLSQDLEMHTELDVTPAMLKALHRLGSSCEIAYQDPRTLSPGERMRMALAALLAEEPDLLLLDEPTNHLDLSGREWLQSFLRSCREGVLAVTHDRSFADAFADRTLELSNGCLRDYAGGYSDMLEQKEERQAQERDAYERQKQDVRRLKFAAEKTLQ
ncbi:MAG TPA: ATP-binding cassette domain-containing protein [Fimbriimonas sp.]|nr:ATP-binding cassette domain-containing protein [Fimbriimonas sp.]